MDRAAVENAQRIVREFRRSFRDADSLTDKPRLVFKRATSRQVKRNAELCSVGMHDIIMSAQADGLLRDPETRRRLERISSVINRPF